MPPASDLHLSKRLLAGDRGALAELLETHYARLYNVCFRMVNHRDDAMEITQQAMLSIVQHSEDFRGQSSPFTWMTRIVINQTLSHLRRQRLRHGVSLDTPGMGDGHIEEDHTLSLHHHLADTREPNPARRVENDEMLDCLKQAVTRIDGPFRAVLVLRDIEELDYQEIGTILDLPVGTVKSRLFRARLALRQEMEKLE